MTLDIKDNLVVITRARDGATAFAAGEPSHIHIPRPSRVASGATAAFLEAQAPVLGPALFDAEAASNVVDFVAHRRGERVVVRRPSTVA